MVQDAALSRRRSRVRPPYALQSEIIISLFCRYFSNHMTRFEKHIFVCENKRGVGHPKGCCSEKGSLEIRELFKKRLKKLGLNTKVRANSSGCLDACEFGPTIVIYPEHIWDGRVRLEDVEEIIQRHIINNSTVERLQIKSKRFLNDD